MQVERDVLQDRLSEQLSEISTLQMRLEEQRRYADTRAKQSNMSLENEIFELKSTNRDLTDQINTQDKQMKQITNLLDKTKVQLKETEKELQSLANQNKESTAYYKNEIKKLLSDIVQIKSKNEANMSVIPELMDTLLAEKNNEVELLKEELEQKSQLIEQLTQSDGKTSARTLSDIHSISEFDGPDIMRRDVPTQGMNSFENLLQQEPTDESHKSVPFEKPTEFQQSDHSLKSSEKQVQFSDAKLISNLNEEIFSLREDLGKLVAEYQIKEANEKTLNVKIQELELALSNKHKEYSDYKEMLQNLETEYEAKVTELDRCKVELEEIRELLKMKDEQTSKLSKNLENKLTQCDSLSESIESLKQDLKEHGELVKVLRKESLDKQIELDDAHKILSIKNEEIKVSY